MKTKIFLAIILLIAVLQIIPRKQPENKETISADLILSERPAGDVEILLKGICYDCHSYQSKYPWYSNFAPLSWWIDDHIEEGREHLNFSIWGNYSAEKKEHKAEECVEEVGEGEMPLTSYQIAHADARLTDEERKLLTDWFATLEQKYAN